MHLLLSVRERAYLKRSGDKMTSMPRRDRHAPEEVLTDLKAEVKVARFRIRRLDFTETTLTT